jgi:DNA repair exonuclease SbcCD ATPase subunit
MAKTSAHVKPITNGSEAHNRREKELYYIDETLSHLNEKWEVDSVKNRLESIRSNYTKTTGQRMQDKATPIRECVVVIDKSTTMNDLKVFSESLQERFGIKTFQIHTHLDEGHRKAKEWKPNLHAHLVFDWTDSQGKTLKLKRQDMAEMQTILSKSLKMERGESSEVKHLNAIQYKVKKQAEQIETLQQEIKTLTPEVENKKLILERFNELKPVLGTWEKDIFRNVKIQPLIASLDKFKEQHDKDTEKLKAELKEIEVRARGYQIELQLERQETQKLKSQVSQDREKIAKITQQIKVLEKKPQEYIDRINTFHEKHGVDFRYYFNEDKEMKALTAEDFKEHLQEQQQEKRNRGMGHTR